MSQPLWAWWGKPAGGVRLSHAVQVLHKGAALENVILEGGPPLDRALQNHQRAHPSMGRNDRLLLGTAVYGFARNREAIRLSLPQAVPGKGDFLVLGLLDAVAQGAEVLFTGEDENARCQGALESLFRERARCTRLLEAASEAPVTDIAPAVRQALKTLFSVPDWWLELGPWRIVGEALRELGRLKTQQRLCLRVQAHRRSRDDALKELQTLAIPARPTRRSPWGIIVEGRQNVLGTSLFRDGTVEVQDEGSQLAACLCDPRPNEKVLDLCAGAGGKSLALGATMEGRGMIVAHDLDPHRLSQTKIRARKAGLGNIRTVADRAEVARLGPYDLVLVDAPCSSSGTLRRNPDVAWRWTLDSVQRLTKTQAEVLDWGATLVKPRKALVYVTCSLLPAENQAQVSGFLERHPDYEMYAPGERRAHGPLLNIAGAPTGAFRLPADLPDYDGDAFFLARMRKAR